MSKDERPDWIGRISQWVMILVCLSSFSGLIGPAFRQFQERVRWMQGADNCRQIVLALKAYAADHHGTFPDVATPTPATANAAFRQLFFGGYIKDEKLFGCPQSPFVPDGTIGSSPAFAEALNAKENHWSLLSGRTIQSPATALVVENTVGTAWPPTWNCDADGQPTPGRAWRSRGIIVGKADGSIAEEQLESVKGSAVPLKGSGQLLSPNGTFLPVLR